jgi:hypothetical protein
MTDADATVQTPRVDSLTAELSGIDLLVLANALNETLFRADRAVWKETGLWPGELESLRRRLSASLAAGPSVPANSRLGDERIDPSRVREALTGVGDARTLRSQVKNGASSRTGTATVTLTNAEAEAAVNAIAGALRALANESQFHSRVGAWPDEAGATRELLERLSRRDRKARETAEEP